MGHHAHQSSMFRPRFRVVAGIFDPRPSYYLFSSGGTNYDRRDDESRLYVSKEARFLPHTCSGVPSAEDVL